MTTTPTTKGPLRKLVGRIAKGVLLLHVATHLGNVAHNYYTETRPTPLRAAFHQEFGFPLQGYAEDVEEDPLNVSLIADAIHKERLEGKLSLNTIGIIPKNYYEKNILQQAQTIITSSEASYYLPLLNNISLENTSVRSDTIHHELKHARTFELIKKNPELLERWKRLATDKEGKSLYMNKTYQFCSRFKGLEELIDKEKYHVEEENKKLGFISNYARTNVYEDIAELCSEAEQDYNRFRELITEEKNEIIIQKITLAEEYGLLPQGTIALANLRKLHQEVWKSHGHCVASLDKEKGIAFLEQSEKFLQEQPGNIHECEIRAYRIPLQIIGDKKDIYFTPSEDRFRDYSPQGIRRVIEEARKCLASPYKHRLYYNVALRNLAMAYDALGEQELAQAYQKADDEHLKRFRAGEVTLAVRGVEDLLPKEP